MREKHVEQALTRAVKQHGGICWKLTSPGTAGVPDRLVILPNKKIAFIEVKAPGKKPRPLQQHRHAQLHALNVPCYTLDNPNNIPQILHEIHTT